MEYNIANEIATSQAVWAILCILLASYFINDMRKENERNREDSRKREKLLMEHLRRSNDSQERTAEALEVLEKRIENIERKVNREHGI